MPSCEVQRTLVKSPPELWAELSDPASLAKHLGEFGEIRTVRIEPETAVEWEAEDVRGIVELKASGWGTKVTLTAVREVAEEETPTPSVAAEPQSLEPLVEVDTELVKTVVESELAPLAEPDPESSALAEPVVLAEPEPELLAEPEPERRPGLFARLFRRRRKGLPTPAPEVLATDEPLATGESAAIEEPNLYESPAPHELVATGEFIPVGEHVVMEEPAPREAPEPASAPPDRPDLAAELAQVEQAMVEQDTALLTAVLDRLGAAHHRPFSRG